MFVIACHNKDNFILNCVESIQKFHDDKILIVDSDSPDKSYFNFLIGNVIIADIGNKNYVDGAIWYAYENYPEEKFYYFLHDSMIVKQNLSFLQKREFTCLSLFEENKATMNPLMKSYTEKQLSKTKYNFPFRWISVFGITFYCSRSVLDKMQILKNVLPSNKIEMESSERIWGICLEQEGYDIMNNSLMKVPYHIEENPYIYKFFPRRD